MIMGLFRRSAPKPESSNQALGASVLAPVVDARVDIIFLHGLTGHREKTWTATGQDEPWPKSLLSNDLPTARIITYGYDADVVNLTRVAGQNTVREHARNLINDLTAHRKDAVGRPIIFVAHSLGGLVCQDALLICINPSEEAQTDILSSTCGIAFLGTPHAGSDMEKFATAVANVVSLVKKPNKKILRVLRSNSEILANIKNDFLTMVRMRDRQGNLRPIELHAFTEEMPVDVIGRRVVEPDSAKIAGYNSDTIHANHMEMTKFNNADDPGYAKVLNRLRTWIEDDDGSISLRNVDDVLLKFQRLMPNLVLAKSEPPASAKELCESSNIERSLQWFKSSAEYTKFRRGYGVKLWLHGECGDGKTVIMSYIVKSPSHRHNSVSIFCSSSDSEEGIVTSIVLQLLRNEDFAQVYRSEMPNLKFQSRGGRQGFIHDLWVLLTSLIRHSPELILVIDGIDKLDSTIRSSFLRRFGTLHNELNGINFRVLISSTKTDDIQNSLSHYQSIDREKDRRECLKTLEFQEWNAREIGVQDVEATGRNFFSRPEYHSWFQSDVPSMLWLEGKPGCGKSTLTKFMVKELEKDVSLTQAKERNTSSQESNPSHNTPQDGNEEWVFNNSTDKNTIISRFYYSFRGGNTQTSHELMLRSIVYQIWDQNSRLFPLIRDRYQMLKKEQKLKWSYNDLKLALKSLHEVNFNLSVFIIVDGMDESNNDKRVDVLEFLIGLATPNPKSRCIIKIFIASRPENNINSRLRPVPHHIKLQEVNKEDIGVVVEGWVKSMIFEDECEEGTLREVKQYIMEHSQGVFMWVTLVLRDLKQHIDDGGYSKSSLNTRLRSLPNELGGTDGFYRTMINSLVQKYNKNREQQERGRRILAWVTFAERPISPVELRDALATPHELEGAELSTYVLGDNRPNQLEKAILSSCGGLAEVRDSHSGPIVQLIHQTAREFLLHKDRHAEPYHLEEAQGDTEIAMTCCRYISIAFRPDFPPEEYNRELTEIEMMVKHLSEKSLLVYALVNFQTHLSHLGSNNEKIRDEFINFIKLVTKRSRSFAYLLLGQWIEGLEWPTKLHADDESARLCLHLLLLCAAETGEKKAAEILVSLRPDLLHIESGKGSLIAMKSSHERPLNAISHITEGRIPFYGEDEQETSIMMLLNLGVDVDLKDTVGRTALSYAAENGHESSIRLLAREGAEVNSKDKAGRTPLSYATGGGYSSNFSTLVELGSDYSLKDRAGRTPISHAAENGQKAPIRWLLYRKDVAKLDSKDTVGRTPLSYAAGNGHHDVVRIILHSHDITDQKLLKKVPYLGASIDMKYIEAKWTSLLHGGRKKQDVSFREIPMVEATINSKDTGGRTPLSYAAENGHEDTISILLYFRANLDSDDTGRTPLSYAIANGHAAVVELLQSYIKYSQLDQATI